MPSLFRPCLSVLAAAMLLPPSSFAFQSPLSDEAVREAYFLGQRHDATFAHFLDQYTQHLPAPETGPYISSVTFFTPFALLVQRSGQQTSGYSAQQAELDHRGQLESVKVIVQILLTDSYGALIPRPTGSRSGSPVGYVPRPYDFWKDFEVRVFGDDSDKAVRPFSSSGRPNYLCSDDGGCALSGATLEFEFPAEAFSSASATIQIDPPEGDEVVLDLDTSSLR